MRTMAILSVLVWAVAFSTWQNRKVPNIPRLLDPLVMTLLQEPARNDPDHKSSFFTALEALAKKHGVNPIEYWGKAFTSPDEGYAIRIGAGADLRVIAILRGDDSFIPGQDTQFLLLLDTEGRLLDWLTCSVSNRLTRWVVGETSVFRTDVAAIGEDDQAQLVIRFIPEDGSVSGNWSHDITHAGRTTTWVWAQHDPTSIRSAEWDKKGLCRLAVREGKFSVLFPKVK